MLGDGIGSNVRKSKLINRRMFLASAAKAVVFFGIVSRLFYLQVEQNKKYLTLSDKNRIRENKLPPVRGEFKDFFGKTIAGNLDVYELHVIPEQVEDFRVLITRVKQILNLSNKHIDKIYKTKNKQKPWETIIISDNLNWNEFSKINYYLYDLPGLKPVISVGRNYPFNESYSHVLGYVAYASKEDLLSNEIINKRHVPGLRVGKNGLEKTFENQLIGTNTIQRFEVNAYGKRINQLEVQNGDQGNSLRITIDTEIQKYTYELLSGEAGSISVMDIFTGEIIAMNSSPSFNPNDFLYGIGSEEWKDLNSNPFKPLVNKTISGLYSPGSTIKPLVALSALENDVIKPTMRVFCKDNIDFYGQKFHCWKKKGHGHMTLKNAIKQSCDIYFYEVARLLGVDRLNETAKKFGLGKIVLKNFFENEKKGVFPSTEWKKKEIGQNWYLGETLITGIGQGYMQTTPLQLCLMTAQLANGGHKIYPKIVINENDNTLEEIKNLMEENFKNQKENKNSLAEATEEIFSINKEKKYETLYENFENINIVKEAMFASTNEVRGTSFSSRIKDPKYQFAGKTGTSQVKRITEEQRALELKTLEIPYNERDHALYIAFGPYKNPRYALSVVVEHGGSGSSMAAPIAKKLFKLIIDRHKLREKIRTKESLKA